MTRDRGEGQTPAEQLAVLVAVLGSDLPALTRGALRRLGEDDEPGSASRPVRRRLVEECVLRCLDAALLGGELNDAAREAAAALGRRCAMAGLSFQTTHRMVHVSVAELRHRAFETLGTAGLDRGARGLRSVTGVTELIGELQFRLLGAVCDGFESARREAKTPDEQEAALRRLLEYRFDHPGETLRREAEGGIDLAPPLVVVVLRPTAAPGEEGGLAPFNERASHLARRFEPRARGPVPYPPTPTSPGFAVLVADAPSSARRRAELRFGLAAACEELHLAALYESAPTIEDLCPAFLRLQVSVPVIDPCVDLLGRVMSLEAVFPYRMAAAFSWEEQEALVLRHIAPLYTGAKNEAAAKNAVATLRAVIEEHDNLSAAGKRLGLTAGGVRSRVRRIERLTGADLETHWYQYAVALRVYDLRGLHRRAWDDKWWRGGAVGALAPPNG